MINRLKIQIGDTFNTKCGKKATVIKIYPHIFFCEIEEAFGFWLYKYNGVCYDPNRDEIIKEFKILDKI